MAELSDPDVGGAASVPVAWPADVDPIAWRLIAPRPDELLLLRAVRRRASEAGACSTVAQLIGRLAAKGWLVTDCRREHWAPTSMAGLAYRMLDVEHLVRALARLDGRSVPAGLRGLVALARELWSDAGPAAGHVPHPFASPKRTQYPGAVFFGAAGGEASRKTLTKHLQGRSRVRRIWRGRRWAAASRVEVDADAA